MAKMTELQKSRYNDAVTEAARAVRNLKLGQLQYIGLFGSQNYELSTDESDFDFVAVVSPSVRALAVGAGKFHKEVELDCGKVVVMSLQEVSDQLQKNSLTLVESFFTEYSSYFDSNFYALRTNVLRALALHPDYVAGGYLGAAYGLHNKVRKGVELPLKRRVLLKHLETVVNKLVSSDTFDKSVFAATPELQEIRASKLPLAVDDVKLPPFRSVKSSESYDTARFKLRVVCEEYMVQDMERKMSECF